MKGKDVFEAPIFSWNSNTRRPATTPQTRTLRGFARPTTGNVVPCVTQELEIRTMSCLCVASRGTGHPSWWARNEKSNPLVFWDTPKPAVPKLARNKCFIKQTIKRKRYFRDTQNFLGIRIQGGLVRLDKKVESFVFLRAQRRKISYPLARKG